MKVSNKQLIPGVLTAAAILCGGAYLTLSSNIINTNKTNTVQAYTSVANPVDPITAPDGYIINFPDINLKKALNKVIKTQQGLANRLETEDITARQARSLVNLYGAQGLNNSSITNLEGAQFLVGSSAIHLANNNITDLTPLKDLPNLKELNLTRNQITDLTPLTSNKTIENITLQQNPNLNSVSPLSTFTKLKVVNLAYTRVADLPPLPNTVEQVFINHMFGGVKPNLSQLANLPKLVLVNANGNRMTPADFAPLKDVATLETLQTAGNNITNLQDLLSSGFSNLGHSSTFSSQIHSINAGSNELIENPIKGLNGQTIPVTETANIKNANADGQLNPNGTHIKLVDLGGSGSTVADWTNLFSRGNINNREFSGKITISYNLPPLDSIAPTFTPSAPEKIISRKGVAININDVTAQDNPGGAGLTNDGITNNSTSINLDPANPVKGNYNLVYKAVDKRNNQATVNREVEITDADQLQDKVNSTTDQSLEGYTADSVEAVKDKKSAAEAVIANNSSTQAQIDQALRDLENAVSALVVDNQPIDEAKALRNREYSYVQDDPEVIAALNNAESVAANPARTKDEVKDAAEKLVDALKKARQEENNRQEDASRAVDRAAQSKSPDDIASAQDDINDVKDTETKQILQSRLDQIKAEYQAKKDALQEAVNRANNPQTTEGMVVPPSFDNEIVRAQNVLNNPAATQSQIEQATQALNSAIDALKADKQPIRDAINNANSQEDFVKNDSAVVAAIQEGETTFSGEPTRDQVKEMAKKINDAVAKAIADEQTRKVEATNALDALKQSLNPDDVQSVKDKINALKKDSDKNDLLAQLADVESLIQKRADLASKIEEAKNTPTNGRTTETVNALTQATSEAEATLANKNSTPGQIEDAISKLNNAINGLKTDKKPVQDAIADHDGYQDWFKNIPEVKAAYEKAKETSEQANPTPDQVAQDAQNLIDAIENAKKAETAQEQKTSTQLDEAEQTVEDNKTDKNTLPVVDVDAIQEEINKVLDPLEKQNLQDRLDAIKRAIEEKRNKIDADKRAEAEAKLAEELKKKREEIAKAEEQKKQSSLKNPNTGFKQNDDKSGLIAAISGLVVSVIAPFAVFFKKRKKDNR